MIEIAQETARSDRLPNATFKAMDAETLDFPDGSLDLAVSRFGFQIFTNPERAAREVVDRQSVVARERVFAST